MPGMYSQILLHIVFSTKHREPWITPDIAERLYPYIGGIVRAEKGTLYDISGVEDHVHLYLRWRPDESISNLMRAVKARSSKWVHETFPRSARSHGKRDTASSRSANRKKRQPGSTSQDRPSITKRRTSRPNSCDCSARMGSNSTSATCSSRRSRGRSCSVNTSAARHDVALRTPRHGV